MKYVELGNLNIPIVKPKKGVDYYTAGEISQAQKEIADGVNAKIDPFEQERQDNESARIANEEARKETEIIRVNNEAKREANEKLRQETFSEQFTRNEEAINNIIDKTEEYNVNAITKIQEYDDNATQRIEEYNSNASLKLQELNDSTGPIQVELDNLEQKNAEQDTNIVELRQQQSTNNSNIVALQKDNETNKQDILVIKEEQSVQDSAILDMQYQNASRDMAMDSILKDVKQLQLENTLLKSQIPNGESEEGECITLNDSSNLPFEAFKVMGNSWQETSTQGNNMIGLLDMEEKTVNGITISVSNQIVNANGTATAGTSIELPFIYGKEFEVGEKYTGSNKGQKATGTTFFLNNSDSETIARTSSGGTKYSTEIPANNIPAKLTIYIASGTVIDNEQFKLMINEGETDLDWEAFMPDMPSPEFQSQIKNVTGSANIAVCNKNLCKVSSENVLIYNNYNNFTIEDDKTIITGNSLFGFKVKVKPNTKYTRTNLISGFISGNVAIRIQEWSKEPNRYSTTDESFVRQLSEEHNKDGEYSLTFTTQSTTTWVAVSVYSDTPVTISEWGLYESSVAPENYIEHNSQQIIFPLSEGQRMYKDSYLADDGIYNKRRQVVLIGNENIGLNGEQENYNSFTIKDYASVIDTSDNVNIMCNMLVANTSYEVNTMRIASSGNIIILLDKDFCEYSSTGLKSKLKELYDAGTPMILEFSLKEEEVEPYTEEQQIVYNEIKKATSYKNITHIFSTDEISPVFKVKYKKDLETINQNYENRLLALESAIIS